MSRRSGRGRRGLEGRPSPPRWRRGRGVAARRRRAAGEGREGRDGGREKVLLEITAGVPTDLLSKDLVHFLDKTLSNWPLYSQLCGETRCICGWMAHDD